MTTRVALTGLLLVGLAADALSQTSSSPASPSEVAKCRLEGSNHQSRKLAELRAAGTAVTAERSAPILADARRITRTCAGRIVVARASATELSALSSLYLYTGDTARAKDVVALALGKRGLSEADRAETILAAEQVAIATFNAFDGINRDAERYVTELDAMSDAVLVQKVRSRELLLGRYEYGDVDDGLRAQARKLLELAQRALRTGALGMTAARAGTQSVNAAYPVMVLAYGSLARGAADFLHTDSALAILAEADRVLSTAYPAARNELDFLRAVYRLVGSKATPIDGKWWINASNGSTVLPGNAGVTVIQFTAHWCTPCRNSYPGMVRLAAR